MRLSALLILLALASCDDIETPQDLHRLLGSTQADAISCLGPPDQAQRTGTREGVLMWKYENDNNVVSLQATQDIAFSLGGRGLCHVVLRVRDGVVVSDHITDNTLSTTGKDSACEPILAGCRGLLEHTPADPLFDPMSIYGDKP